MNQEYDDNFLAKWLNNELDEATLNKFEKTKEFKELSQIIDAVDSAKIPEYDVDKNFKATLEKIQQQKAEKPILAQKETKVRRLIPSWAYAAASCVIAFIGYMYFFDHTTYTTQLAEKLQVELPDGSKVHLNADSEITYKTYNWNSNKKVQLKGEAFFDVQKGKTFSVATKQGTVTVLGTTFTVKDRENLYEVACYTGKVGVTTKKDDVKLSKGQGYTLKGDKSKTYNTQESEPSWIKHQSVFMAADIKDVIAELERQYNITVTGKEHLKDVKFSGRFPHKDINRAIKTVFTAMQIPYKVTNKRNIVIKKH